MDEFERKREKALSLLAGSGVWKPNYLPPTFPLLWRIGVRLPPPHFMSFAGLVLLMGLPFGLFWTGLYLLNHQDGAIDWPAASLGLLAAILVPGLIFALYYRAGRRRLQLPRWIEL